MNTSIISRSWNLLICITIAKVHGSNLLAVLVSIIRKSGAPRASVGAIVVEVVIVEADVLALLVFIL